MNVDPARLQPGRVPMLCAKTGVPATRLLRHRVPVWRRISYWWLLPLGLGLYGVVVLARTRFHRIALPIAEPVRRRYATLRALRLAAAAVVGAVPLATGSWYAAVVPALGWWWLHRRTQAAWVRPQGAGGSVRLHDAHYDFKEAVRGNAATTAVRPAVLAPLPPSELPPVMPAEPAPVAPPAVMAPVPAPGWYPDPSGEYAVRLWDGSAWTEQVAGAA